MARRLGEFLIERGLLSPRQLQEALRSQRIFGGTLGTHLVELGLLQEEKVVDALSAIHGVGGASREEVLNARDEVVALLSADFSKRHRAIPFKVEDDDLYLAMQNPADSLAIHEAAFLTGFNVVPTVTSDRIVRAALAEHHRATATLMEPSPAAQEITAQAAAPAAGTDQPNRSSTQTPWSLRELAKSLSEATDRDAVLDHLVREVARYFPRAGAFAIRGTEAELRRAHGMPVGQGRTVSLSIEQPSVLSAALSAGEVQFGPVASTPANQDLYTLLGGRIPRTTMVLPVQVKGHTVLVLYGDDLEEASVAPDFQRLRKVAALASLSLEILILRAKILRET